MKNKAFLLSGLLLFTNNTHASENSFATRVIIPTIGMALLMVLLVYKKEALANYFYSKDAPSDKSDSVDQTCDKQNPLPTAESGDKNEKCTEVPCISLIEAVKNKNITAIKQLLTDPQTDPNERYGSFSCRLETALTIAVKNKDVEIVKCLLAHPHTDPNLANHETIPLIHAIKNGDESIVNILLEDPRLEVDLEGCTSLMIAIREKKEALIKILLDDSRLDPNVYDKQGCTALISAARWGNEMGVKLLLNHPDIDINKQGPVPERIRVSESFTAFHYACRFGHYEIVKLFLNDVRLDFSMPEISSPARLYYSGIDNENINIMELLLQDPRINPNKLNDYGYTPLHEHSKYGNSAAVKLLLQRSDIEPNILNKPRKNDHTCCYPTTALHIACSQGYIEVVKLLLEHPKTDPNACNEQGNTPLHEACSNHSEDPELINLLIKYGCNINAKNMHSETPLQVAYGFFSRQYSAVKILMHHPLLDMNDYTDREENSNYLGNLCYNSFPTDIIESFLEKFTINFDYVYTGRNTRKSLLHRAAQGNNPDTPPILLRYNYKLITQKDSEGYIPLEVAEKRFQKAEKEYHEFHHKANNDRFYKEYIQTERMYHLFLNITHSCSSSELYYRLKSNGLYTDIIKHVMVNYALINSELCFARYAFKLENYYLKSYDEKEIVKKEFFSQSPLKQLL